LPPLQGAGPAFLANDFVRARHGAPSIVHSFHRFHRDWTARCSSRILAYSGDGFCSGHSGCRGSRLHRVQAQLGCRIRALAPKGHGRQAAQDRSVLPGLCSTRVRHRLAKQPRHQSAIGRARFVQAAVGRDRVSGPRALAPVRSLWAPRRRRPWHSRRRRSSAQSPASELTRLDPAREA
jgi:hypothetical protein